MYYSLLDDPIISVRFTNDEVSKTNLPDILTALTEDRVLSFEALQSHQQQPWFSFLVQLAAMAVARENYGKIPSEANRWRAILIALADGSKAAWHLVVEDVSQPAFMQSPVPEGSLEDAGYDQVYKTPDDLDMLLTTKNHEIKRHRISNPKFEHWIYSLITLQTLEGYSGRDNYGIIRMNGGRGNRPLIGLTPNLSWNNRFQRDLNVLLNNRNELLKNYNSNGFSLLWLSEWNGSKKHAIPIYECDPYFIEICRRIRFNLVDDLSLRCWKKSTKSKRISAPDNLNGKTNDPWTPIIKNEGKALSVDKYGFLYNRLQAILLGEEFKKPIALEFDDQEKKGAYLIAMALVRGKSETKGFYRRILKISERISSILLNNSENKELLAKRSSERVALAAKTQSELIKPTIRILLRGGLNKNITREQMQKENEKLKVWIDRFDREIDRRFFDSLWVSVEMEPEEAKREWVEVLLEEAEKQILQAEHSIPISQIRRLRAISKARSVFYGRVKDVLEFSG